MGTIYSLQEDSPRSVIKRATVRGASAKAWGATVGMCGGIVALMLGALLTLIAWITNPSWHHFSLGNAGTALFLLAITLLLLGAHCLDLIDKEETARRRSRLKPKEGLRVEPHDLDSF
jgi:hypothetical protein